MPEETSKADYIVGVDIGGTKILSGVFNGSSKCLAKVKLSTKSQRGVASVIQRIARSVREAVDEADLNLKNLRGVGVGAPGGVDGESGRVLFAPNLGWEGVPLKRELEAQLGVPVFVANDCQVSMLGVYSVELKSKPRHVLGIFIGTGIGGALILDGELYTGAHNTAAEVGHMLLSLDGPKCSCGNKGCFEAMASRKAIFQALQAEIKQGEKTVLTEMLGEDLRDLRSGDLRKAIRRGDKLVSRIVDQTAEYIGAAVGNLINLFNPEVLVLGGGVIEALSDEMMGTITKTAEERAVPGAFKKTTIVASMLGDNAGITGAAVLARMETK